MYSSKGSFARKQLEKHGWKEGAGLGSKEDGISEAIRVKIKHNTTGVGHDPAREFTHHWWDVAFNKAASSITVEDGENGVIVRKKQKTKKQHSDVVEKTLYSNFIKGSLLKNGLEKTVEKEAREQASSDEETEKKVQTLMLPEDVLFKKCGGRTAHKGARHGLKLNGKLARVKEQEQLLLAQYKNTDRPFPLPDSYSGATSDGQNPDKVVTDYSISISDKNSAEKKHNKKKKKRKAEMDVTASSDNINRDQDFSGDTFSGEQVKELGKDHKEDGDILSLSGKKEKKRKEKFDPNTCEYSSIEQANKDTFARHKKRSKRKTAETQDEHENLTNKYLKRPKTNKKYICCSMDSSEVELQKKAKKEKRRE